MNSIKSLLAGMGNRIVRIFLISPEYPAAAIRPGIEVMNNNGAFIMCIHGFVMRPPYSTFKQWLQRKEVVRRAAIALGLMGVASSHGVSAQAAAFVQTNRVTDNQAMNQASIPDTNLVNPWGISRGTSGPFWISDNNAGVDRGALGPHRG